MRLLITCEHAGHTLPENFAYLFKGQNAALQSHRGWDPGAAEVARHLSKKLHAPCFQHETTRLLVEVNRSLNSPQLFSEFTMPLEHTVKEFLIKKYYSPYRKLVTDCVTDQVDKGKFVAHFSIHSFTPFWQGAKRTTDIGILFDPDKKAESKLALSLQHKLQKQAPALQIDLNKPYLGKDDGFTTTLRTAFGPVNYAGIEIEINQQFYFDGQLDHIKTVLCKGLKGL
jgi:predicted N-formylglutamate amidohydrolase